MTIAEACVWVSNLKDLKARLGDRRHEAMNNHGGTAQVPLEDLVDSIEAIEKCIQFVNKTKVNI